MFARNVSCGSSYNKTQQSLIRYFAVHEIRPTAASRRCRGDICMILFIDSTYILLSTFCYQTVHCASVFTKKHPGGLNPWVHLEEVFRVVSATREQCFWPVSSNSSLPKGMSQVTCMPLHDRWQQSECWSWKQATKNNKRSGSQVWKR